ncbi:MAG: rRNA (uracil1939-C5)-methyltransferase [Solirubrobacteraceae bacterium]|jgi:23S rRNA (uracil1939-C5)-methyltransferase|nr:rRNA (uracil1939-C5)-methyltransferase [Solirubrobacteraceae bacterium]
MLEGMESSTFTRPERGAELDLRIDALANGGNGIARLDGYVVFVSGAIPGDLVRAVVTKRKRAYAEARTLEVLEPSPERIAPLADHPGAPWQVLPYERQLAVKHEQVRDALTRIGHLDGFALDDIVPAVEQWRYRNKLEYSFGTGDDGALLCGFHAPGSWHEIVPISDCLLASERSNAVREQVVAWCREQGLSAFDRRTHSGMLRNLVVREGRRTGELQARLVTGPGDLDTASLAAAVDCQGLTWTRTEALAETTLGGVTEIVSGPPALMEEIGGLRVAISPQAFFQTNTEMAERLYAIAADLADLKGWERVYDLYCGIGTVGLSLAARAGEIWGLEIVEQAVADAIANARRNEIDNAHFFAGDVRLALRELVEQASRPDVCVIDPPRAGLSQKIVRRVIETASRRIVYISCNPTTLAPNAAQLVEAGYALRRVVPVDMFPQTPHIECVAVLDRA